MSVSRHHTDWLSLVEVSGPFVSLPVLLRIFPQGLEPRDPAQAKALRSAYEEWNDNPTAPGRQRAWLLYVLTAVLGYPQDQITEGQSLPAGLETNMPEMGETLRPDFALVSPNCGNDLGQTQLLIISYPVNQGLDKPVIGKHWKATPATRMMELLHGTGIPLGLVTNGEQWMLVYAPRGETTGYASWYGALWLDEQITLRAFHSLLGVRRFFGVATDSTLLALFKESAQDQQEVTDQLGYQVREAVEVLVQSFDALDKESSRKLLKGVAEITLYEAALTIMMRLVFLFAAEERGLLHLGKPLYDYNYAVSTLQEQLQEVADRYGEEILERRLDAWARLLATFRAVYGGIQHQDLLMQAYGGSLFDPDRYPFLEGRSAGTFWRTSVAEPLAVNNRVVLHLLNSLQRLRTKVGTGTTTETRRVSFRALGVEQIGHIYEGLLDHTAIRATEPILGIKGTRSKEPEIPLSTLESLLTQGADKLFDYLKEETGRTSISPIKRAFEEGSLLDEHKMLIACNHDEALVARLRPFIGLIRDDSFERPLVILPGSAYVTAGTARRSTGTHYTPPSLTEPIVQQTLEPLVYEGPAEGWPREQWKLKSPKAILDLKVCDMTMGSGAFLVQTCRYLAERLVEAWENEEKKHPGKVLITPDGKFSDGLPSERLVPEDPDERIAIARRFVADRCLYGVDINPMAVEMAKLSMWLITVDAHRPFTFLDHAFKCGDSLLGITSLEQLENFSMKPSGGKQLGFATLNLWQYVEEAKKKREALEAMPSDVPEQLAAKATLYAEAKQAVAKLNAVADALIAVELKGLSGKAYEAEREAMSDCVIESWNKEFSELKQFVRRRLEITNCFHWPLEFPEVVMKRGGFDAFLGNPPFLGGTRISMRLGDYYLQALYALHPSFGNRCDLVALFFLRCSHLITHPGCFGLIGTSTVAEGDTRKVGLERILKDGGSISRVISSIPWPGQASQMISVINMYFGGWKGTCYLNEKIVDVINAYFEASYNDQAAYHLDSNSSLSFEGAKPAATGFVISHDEAAKLIALDCHNKDVLFPYIVGDDLNSNPSQSPSAWVIDFGRRTLSQASLYTECMAIVVERVKPYRETVKRKAHREQWWMHGELRPGMYEAIAGLSHVLVHSYISKYVAFSRLPNQYRFAAPMKVFAFDSFAPFALLQSSVHDVWVIQRSSTIGGSVTYTSTDVFETFPFPSEVLCISLEPIGAEYESYRKEVMLKREIGLTETYNRFHDPYEASTDIKRLRQLHVEMDHAIANAYGWTHLDLGHGFFGTKLGQRFTISEAARGEVLDRLLALNHQRHAEEEAERAKYPNATATKKIRKKKVSDGQVIMDI